MAGWRSRLCRRSKVSWERASGERGGRALRPGRCPPHSRTTPATPPGGKMHPGKALAHSQRCSGEEEEDDEEDEEERVLWGGGEMKREEDWSATRNSGV